MKLTIKHLGEKNTKIKWAHLLDPTFIESELATACEWLRGGPVG